jgi:hypothetical protein
MNTSGVKVLLCAGMRQMPRKCAWSQLVGLKNIAIDRFALTKPGIYSIAASPSNDSRSAP